MMKKTTLFALAFILLFIFSSSQTLFAQETDGDIEDSIALESESDNSGWHIEELRTEINGVIFQKLSEVGQFIKKYLLIAWAFFLSWPPIATDAILIIFFVSVIGIVSSHVIGIYKNRNKWEKHPNYDLMYSYFVKSGTLQRKNSYRDAHDLLRDRRWSWVSFAGLAFRLGNYNNVSIILTFAMSFVYIPLSIIGFIEMAFRIALGTVWLVVFNLIHRLVLFITKLITYLLVPVSLAIDKFMRNIQYCPHCYETFNLPEFTCPKCGKVHTQLIPGNCGVLFVRCACNQTFLPCVSFTGRSRLDPNCPSCKGKLAATNAKHFSITVVGEKDIEKAAFIETFSGFGRMVVDSESHTYSIVHKQGNNEKDNLVFYDTLAEYVVSENFLRSPKYFGFCDGIILLIDPASAENDIRTVVVNFIRHYYRVSGFPQGKMSDVPVAVVINQTDTEITKTESRNYLAKVGLENVLNNIDATFTNVDFFPVSAMGHTGVKEPVVWIARKKHSKIADVLNKEVM